MEDAWGEEPELVTTATTRPVGRTLFSQRWEDVTFLHWAVDPALVAPLLPRGTRPDVLDGATYVGLIGFSMVDLGIGRGPGLPWVGTFLETNVRLYSVDRLGRRAVVFRSLDASRLPAVLAARSVFALPYLWSRMRLHRAGDELTYSCRRRWPGPRGARSSMQVRVGPALTSASPLEHFLTARWGLHTRVAGRLLHLPNEHPAWPLHHAELLRLDDELVAAAGLPGVVQDDPISVLHAPAVPVRFGGPQVVAPSPRG